MAYVTIPKDLTKVIKQGAFRFDKRQLVCFTPAALIGVPLFFMLKGSAGTTTAAFVMIIVMLPFFLLAMYERNGLTLEVYLKHFIRKFLLPKERPYQTNNFYAVLKWQHNLEKEVKALVRNDRKLTRKEKREIETVIRKGKGDGKPHTAQHSIPFDVMYPNGLCKMNEKSY